MTALLLAVLLAIALIDRHSLRIPDWLSLPLVVLGLVLAWILPGIPIGAHVAGAIMGYALFAGIGAWFFRRRGIDGLGLGDAKLFAAAGAWLGWQALPAVLLIAAGGGLAQSLIMNRGRRDAPIAFGPWLALGFAIIWIVSGRSRFWSG